MIICIFIWYVTYWVYQDSQLPAPSAPKGDSKFEILLVKILGLKQKKNKIKYFQMLEKK